MQPHPRIRKTVKWGGLVVSVLLIVAWVGSGWRYGGFRLANGYSLTLHTGHLLVDYMTLTKNSPRWMGGPYMNTAFHLGWWGGWYQSSTFDSLWLPLWPVVGASMLITGTAWRLDTLARRRASKHLCRNCQYDRTGLAPGAVCPECGSAAAGSG